MDFDKFENTIELLNKIGEEVKEKYKDKLKTGDVFASGKLYNSVNYKLITSENGIKLFFEAEDYWYYIENGRKAGGKFPPIKLIEKWIIQKGLPNKPGLAFLIARSIAENGIKPKPYLKAIKQNINNNYKSEIEKSIKEDLNIYIKEKINKIKNDGNIK